MFELISCLLILTSSFLSRKTPVCNKDLLRIFHLQGSTFPRYSQNVKICGKQMDTCCSVLDEIKILKYWQEYSKPHINHKVERTVQLY